MEYFQIVIPIHPGVFVRDNILKQKKISVSKAAEHIGISRTGVSSFLNGNVGATPNMASRIEKAFGFSAEKLIQMQKEYDLATAENDNDLPPPGQYAPPFLKILSNQIEEWADGNIEARHRLPVFLRTLVHSTGRSLTEVDFPGNNNAQRHGWDGYVEAGEGAPWVPEGKSGWEFGCNEKPETKAKKDYAQRVKKLPTDQKSEMIFVFVTPRHWPGKINWRDEKRKENEFRDVRVYDASDLEQWIEQSLAAQSWFAAETKRSNDGVRNLETCWNDWLQGCDNKISGELFESVVSNHGNKVERKLRSQEPNPLTIVADSVGESLSFLHQIFQQCDDVELKRMHDKVLVFDNAETLGKLADGLIGHIVVATNRDTEKQLPCVPKGVPKIIVARRNAANTSPDIVLQPIGYDAFQKGLEASGFSRDDITRYSRESGRSLTILRRRLSNIPAVKSPEWSTDQRIASSLVPFVLAGAWETKNESDKLVLRLISNDKDDTALEDNFRQLLHLEDSPVWNIGSYRGLASSIDALFAIAPFIADDDLKRFFEIAEIVLGEDDPALDLEEKHRFAAQLYGKKREFSSTLRKNLSEVFLLLAIYGPELFKDRAINIEFSVFGLVEKLLKPVTTRKLEALDRDLTVLAEAAPGHFLSILEEDLEKDEPETFGLLRPVKTAMFGGCSRSGLLWALETISWDTSLFNRVVLALGKLSTVEINDNVVSKPINTLFSIFRNWMPQTSANHEERLAALKLLIARYPEIGWQVCISQIKTGPQSGGYNQKPTWRTDGYGHGEPFKTYEPIWKFQDEAIELLLNWESVDQKKLNDLIGRIHGFPPKDQDRLWQRIRDWVAAGALDKDKAELREKIRTTVLSRRAKRHREKENGENLVVCATDIMGLLEPDDILLKHSWLFRQHWVDESADEFDDEEFDYRKREERIRSSRAEVLTEIYESEGFDGIIRLAGMSKASGVIGHIMAYEVLNENTAAALVAKVTDATELADAATRSELVAGILRTRREPKDQEKFLKTCLEKSTTESYLEILLLAPVERITWNFVGTLRLEVQKAYWQKLNPGWLYCDVSEKQEAVRQFIKAKRPRAGFSAIHAHIDEIEPQLLFDLMTEMVGPGNDKPGEYQLQEYDIERTFELLHASKQFDLERMALLEFSYLDALSKPWSDHKQYDIPNLNEYIARNPNFFVQAIVWSYKRSDDQADPDNWCVPEEKRQDMAMAGHKLLEGVTKMPGYDVDGTLKTEILIEWISRVRTLCSDLSRSEIGDICIGKLLSHAPNGEDKIWPCEPVRDALEILKSSEIGQGLHTGRYNSRGVVWRGEGGEQERELAKMYKNWADAVKHTHPYVAGGILTSLAKTYDWEAKNEDMQADVRRRLD